MQKIQTFLKQAIQIIFIAFMALMLFYNFTSLGSDFSAVLVGVIAFLIIGVILFFLYKKKKINKLAIVIVLSIAFLVGIAIRVYIIQTSDFQLASDFKLYFNVANGINNGVINERDYLLFNGYVYNYASVLAPLIKIFGSAPMVALYFNLIVQLLTVFIIYKILRIKLNKMISFFGATLWFLMPTVIFANMLVSTETFFMLFFMLSIYVIMKLLSKKYALGKETIICLILGVVVSLANGIRPVMAVFLIALVIIYILDAKKISKFIPLAVCLVAYVVTSNLLVMYEENGIGSKLKSGALGWSLYFGANYEAFGGWTPEDAAYANNIVNNSDKGDSILAMEAFERYKEMGLVKSIKLFDKKYELLWTDTNSTYPFFKSLLPQEQIAKYNNYDKAFNRTNDMIVILILITVIACSVKEFRKKNFTNVFLQLFIIGYIMSNLLVVLNGRYNFPAYPLFIIIALQLINYVKREKKESKKDLSKIDNAKTLVIIPVHNEERNIKSICNSIIESKVSNLDYIVINDGSTDNTEKCCIDNGFKYITLTQNIGIGGAVQTGYKYALKNNYDVVIQIAGYGQHDIKYIKNLVKPITDGKAHFVIGSRFIKNTRELKKKRKFSSKLISSIIETCIDKKIYDPTSSFRAANKDVIKEFANNYPVEYPESETIVRLVNKGYTVEEIAVDFNKEEGTSVSLFKRAYDMISVSLAIILASMKEEI